MALLPKEIPGHASKTISEQRKQNDIARHASKEIFERAKETGRIAEWSETLNSLANLVQMPEVAKVISDPRVTTTDLADFMRETMLGTSLSSEEKKLITDLGQKRSLHLLPLIRSYYQEREKDAAGSKDIFIKTAFPLDKIQVASITDRLKDRFNVIAGSVVVEIDQSLIGGVIIRFGDKVIDGSIKGKLAALEKSLKS
ncbi:MAG TPA: F0F1 ATP synthase subunit delta [Alphaproteobacteria bacterium]|nr:F0F1 ATP synthase subunit delta [Alphaproteobacteria bacterium]